MNAATMQAALDRARKGDAQALGELLECHRPYVQALVRALRRGRLQARLGDSDFLQDALLEAHRCFADFRGTTLAELTAWLRQLVIHSAGHTIRGHLGTGKRDAHRDQPADGLSSLLPDSVSTPSRQAIRHERSALIDAALTRLPDDMQFVLLARHFDDMPYADIAQHMGRNEDAVRGLYTRALRRLREECQGDAHSGD